jgi:glutathione S-transferase
MYQAVGSPGSRLTRVVWMLEELGEPYAVVACKPHSETMLLYNPSGKMPALVDGDFVLTDSGAICAYLAHKHPGKGLGAAPGLAGRAMFDSWMNFALSELEAPLWNKLRHRFILPETVRADVGAATAFDFAKEIASLDARLGDRKFALEERFTAVDVVLGHIGHWALNAKFAIPSERVGAYFQRVLARPAFARALAREREAAPQREKAH